MAKTPDLTAVLNESRTFPGHFDSLHLGTCNPDGEPDASYAPYIEHDGKYYIYVSELSPHTANLAETKRCSALFIESEAEAKHLFGRRRLTLQCSVTEHLRGSSEFESLLDRFVEKFGPFMGMLRTLTDFHLYCLHPESGSYVAGFGQAYTLTGEGLGEIRHRQEQGHRQQKTQDGSAPSEPSPPLTIPA